MAAAAAVAEICISRVLVGDKVVAVTGRGGEDAGESEGPHSPLRVHSRSH